MLVDIDQLFENGSSQHRALPHSAGLPTLATPFCDLREKGRVVFAAREDEINRHSQLVASRRRDAEEADRVAVCEQLRQHDHARAREQQEHAFGPPRAARRSAGLLDDRDGVDFGRFIGRNRFCACRASCGLD